MTSRRDKGNPPVESELTVIDESSHVYADNQSSEVLDMYRKQLAKYKLLTPAEELQYAETVRESKRSLMRAYLGNAKSRAALSTYLSEETAGAKTLYTEFFTEGPSAEQVHDLRAELLTLLSAQGGVTDSTLHKVNLPTEILLELKKTEGLELTKAQQKQIQNAELDLLNARNRLVEGNVRLVVKRAGNFANQGLPMDDLIQEGNLGLMRAIDKFDPSKGFKLSTYATWWIDQAFGRALSNKSRIVRLPVHMVEDMNRVNKFRTNFHQKTGEHPTDLQIAVSIQMTVEKVRQILEISPNIKYLDEGTPSEDSGANSYGSIADENSPDPFEMVSQKQLRDKVTTMLSRLSPRDEKIIRMRFGIGEEKQSTLEEIGKLMNVSRERIRQLESAAFQDLKIIGFRVVKIRRRGDYQ